MTRPTFNPQVSLGNVLQIGAMLVAVGIAWGMLSSDIRVVDERARSNTASIERQAGQIVAMQRTEARTDARLQSMEAGILRIEASVADLVRYFREVQR